MRLSNALGFSILLLPVLAADAADHGALGIHCGPHRSAALEEPASEGLETAVLARCFWADRRSTSTPGVRNAVSGYAGEHRGLKAPRSRAPRAPADRCGPQWIPSAAVISGISASTGSSRIEKPRAFDRRMGHPPGWVDRVCTFYDDIRLKWRAFTCPIDARRRQPSGDNLTVCAALEPPVVPIVSPVNCSHLSCLCATLPCFRRRLSPW